MTLDLATVQLKKGKHSSQDEGTCLLEVVSIFAGLPFSDYPVCTEPTIAAYARALNDAMPDDQRQRLIPFIPRLTEASNGATPQQRAFLCAEYAVRVFAAAALRDAGLNDLAKSLAELPVIDSLSARSAALSAARSATDSATRSATRSAALSAYSAARSADSAALSADSAALSAARDPWEKPIELLDKLIALGHETPA